MVVLSVAASHYVIRPRATGHPATRNGCHAQPHAASLVQASRNVAAPSRAWTGAPTLTLRRKAAAGAPPCTSVLPHATVPQTTGGAHASGASSADDVVIVAACRTPLCKAKVGGLKDAHTDDLLAAVLKGVLASTGMKPEEIGDVCFGSGLGPSSKRANEARIAMFLAGFPPSVPCYTVNRQCAAGLQAIADVAAGIHAGYYDVGIAGGVESMSQAGMAWEGSDNPRVAESQYAQDCLLPMGITSDNVAKEFNVPREEQDRVAVSSHAKAAAAKAEGRFKAEIVPVKYIVKDPETGKESEVTVTEDDGIRGDFTIQKLSKMHPCFQKGGTTTVGNACQVTDGAAAVMLMKRSEAQRRGLPVMATLRSFAAVGVPPAVMGIGPAVAVPKALSRAGLSKDDVDIYEINEAFGSQAAYCVRELGLDMEKVNPNGGAIALGHPIGCTGARQTVTLVHEMARRNTNGNGQARYGVVSMCTGSGMGAAAVFESESDAHYGHAE